MRMGVIAGAIAVATAACGSAAATTSAQCGPSGARTLAVDRVARVYETGGSVYGCAERSGHAFLLAANQPRPGQPRMGPVALAGVVVAYGATTMGVDTGSATVTVRRLDNGRTLHSLSAVSRTVGPESFQSVDSIVVKSGGAAAWIAHAGSIIHQHASQAEVDRVDRRGRSALDTAAIGSLTSLRLRASRLSWRHGGAVRTASLL